MRDISNIKCNESISQYSRLMCTSYIEYDDLQPFTCKLKNLWRLFSCYNFYNPHLIKCEDPSYCDNTRFPEHVLLV